MHVTASLAEEEVEVEVPEDCRTLEALQGAVAASLPHLCVGSFDIVVAGHVADDEAVLSLAEGARLNVMPSLSLRSKMALREAGREVSGAGLRSAAKAGDMALCTLYLDAGVSPSRLDVFGRAPLYYAASGDQLEICRLLLDREQELTNTQLVNITDDMPLRVAVQRKRRDICELLLDRQHAVHGPNAGSTTLLHEAAQHSREICELLLDRGHDIQCTDRQRKTPLHIAVRSEQREICELLLDRGHDVQCVDACGVTPLHIAAKYSHEICELLLDRGHDVQCVDKYSRTPLHIAARSDRKTCELLLDRGHDVQSADKHNTTPLHIAALYSSNYEICDLLLDRHHAFDCVDSIGQTPLMSAKKNRACDMFQHLLDRLPPSSATAEVLACL